MVKERGKKKKKKKRGKKKEKKQWKLESILCPHDTTTDLVRMLPEF